MALKKQKIYPSGIVTSYHRIGDITALKFDTQTVCFIVEEYLDEAARKSGKDPVASVRLDFFNEDFPFSKTDAQNILSVLYTQLKKPVMVADGTDADGKELQRDQNFYSDAESV